MDQATGKAGDQATEHDLRNIERLVYQSWWNADAEAGVDAERFFTADGLMEMPARTLRGHAEIAAGYKLRQARGPRLSRHLIANLRIDVESADTAFARYTATLYASNGVAPRVISTFQAVCDVEDEMVREAVGWLLKRRTVTTIFIAPDHDSVMLVSPPAENK